MQKFGNIFIIVLALSCNALITSPFTAWQEYANDPVYTPYNVASILDDYFPCTIFDKDQFHGHGASVLYKMWHQGANGIALSYSNDGITWNLVGDVVLDPTLAPNVPLHASVVYDKDGFHGSPYHYKMWYWTGNTANVPPALTSIKFTQSTDGVIWTTPVATTQDTTFFLADSSQAGSYFYHLYGFGQVLYNSHATSTPGNPFSFPYVTFFDSSAEEITPQTTDEAIGLAYSSDGIHWIRYGTQPILIPSGSTSDWDGKYAYRASVIKLNNTYHMFYSGSSGINNPDASFSYTFGIGHAISPDGIHWTKDGDNPIFTINDAGQTWRNGRTLAPSVAIIHQAHVPYFSTFLQMWFSGGTNSGSNFNSAAIGLANLHIPKSVY